MKLYYFPIAPNPTKVRVYLAEKGIEIPMERVSLIEGEQRSERFLGMNAMGKLPVLELDDGSFVNESLPIIEYFEELHPDPPLIGTDPETRLRVRALERHCDIAILIAQARFIHATNSPLGLPPNPGVAEHSEDLLAQGLGVLEAKMADREFVAGDFVSIADCTLWAAYQFATFRELDFDSRYPNVRRWREGFAKRPSVDLPF